MTANDVAAKPASTRLREIAEHTNSEKWRCIFGELAVRVEGLEHAASNAAWQIEELQSELRAEDEQEQERWQCAADIFDEAHQSLGHPGTAALCSADLCRRMTHVFDNP